MNPGETFHENGWKHIHISWPILALFGTKKGLTWKFEPQRPFFTHTWKDPRYACKPNFSENFLIKWPKTSKTPIVLPIFVIDDPLQEIEGKKNQNSTSTTFWAILLCTFLPKIGKIRWKLRQPIRFEKGWRRTDRWPAQHGISSADYVNSRAKKVIWTGIPFEWGRKKQR